MVELDCKSAASKAAFLHSEISTMKSDKNRISTEGEEEEMERKSRKRHPHGDRRTKILKSHPSIASLCGRNPLTAALSVILVTFQLVVAVLSTSYLPIWGALLSCYFVGAVVDHALWVLIHDFAHNLVFKSVSLNRAGAIFSNIPHIIPTAMTFRFYHILHHIELNQVHRDPDVPTDVEARFVGNSPVRKALWLAFFWLIQSFRLAIYTYKIPSKKELLWIASNTAVGLSCNYLIWRYLGLEVLVYMLLSSLFSIGLHPLGARWIQEHYPTQPFQTTYSYYGPLNRVAFNIGFHNEHHDFPSVPWNKLPKVRAEAPEYYNGLYSYKSYTKLLLSFIFMRQWSLQDRIDMEHKNFD